MGHKLLWVSMIVTLGFATLVGWLSSWIELNIKGSQLPKWKCKFFTCPCCKLYRVSAVDQLLSYYAIKITIFVSMWNLGQFCEKLIFC